MRIFRYEALQQDEGRKVLSVLQKEMRLSRSLISRLKFHNGLFKNGEQVRTDQIVRCGDIIEAKLPDDKPAWDLLCPSDGKLSVAYEDEDLMIVDKEAGIPSIASAKKQGDTLEGRVFSYFNCPENFVYRPVNRLDKGTGGLMVIAKNAFAQEKLQKDLHSEFFIRRYLALGKGKMPAASGTIDLPIGKEKEGSVRRVIRQDGKCAVTHYWVLREENGYSLVRLQLETGRTHQIRVHMKAMGCPLAGDYLYGEEMKEFPDCFALHSCYVKIRHPVTGVWIERESPCPPMWEKLMEDK